jgi:2-polyprenyl-3-methyl-5-hydroxy-6-metoxy-1,4-benzoquinol methylase
VQELWNSKFSREEFLYGLEVNDFIKENAHFIPKEARVLCLGEGEGRNAIYFAKKGCHVEALDASDIGLKKLHKEAAAQNVAVTTRHTLIENWQAYGEYDAIVSTYMHLPQAEQVDMFRKVLDAIKNDGFFIVEFFSTDQLNFQSGGPKDINLLYNLAELHKLFSNLPCTIYKLSQEVVTLGEGKGHNAAASVIRIILKKSDSE